MSSTQVTLQEEDVVRLLLEFLNNHGFHISQLSLERETGIINGNYADDVLFLRQLILDGQWDDVLEFIQPLTTLKNFETNKFNYAILRHKYIELLCIRSEIKAYTENVDEVVKVLAELEKIVPSKEEYSNLCLLLTLPSVTDHAEFKKWNPSDARVECFREIYPLVEQFLPCDKKSSGNTSKFAKNDRLMQLLIKGLLYESCVVYCQLKASGSLTSDVEIEVTSSILEETSLCEADLGLISWLQTVPPEVFNMPFEQRMLNIDVERLEKPSLHTSWTEHMLITPIKPRAFPHLAMPFRRPRSATDAMTRSLRPLPDGAPRHPTIMALSAMDYGPSSSCFGAFHLTGIKGIKPMNSSVDRLFENNFHEEIVKTKEELGKLKPIEDVTPSSPVTPDNPEYSVSSLASGSHSNKATPPETTPNAQTRIAKTTLPDTPNFRREMLKEYQIQKQKECDDYIRQLSSKDPRGQESITEVPQGQHSNSSSTAGPDLPGNETPNKSVQEPKTVPGNEGEPYPAQLDYVSNFFFRIYIQKDAFYIFRVLN